MKLVVILRPAASEQTADGFERRSNHLHEAVAAVSFGLRVFGGCGRVGGFGGGRLVDDGDFRFRKYVAEHGLAARRKSQNESQREHEYNCESFVHNNHSLLDV